MKKIIFLLLLLPFGSSLIAQNDYHDLLELYVDEKYDRVLYRAEDYTLNEKTKKDPLPYLFMSMAYYKISKDEKWATKFPDSFKNSLKYMSKYCGKDKQRQYIGEYEDFVDELRGATIAEAEVLMDQLKYTKTKAYYNYLVDMDPNDAGAWIMQGLSEKALRSKKESEISFNTAKDILVNKKCSDMTDFQKGLLKEGLMRLASSLSDEGNKNGAKEWLDLGTEYFTDDKEYQVHYNMIVG